MTGSKGRVMLMLAGFVLAIAGAVIVTDIVSPRDRTKSLREVMSQPATATAPATTRAATP